ncbi:MULTISPECIES: DUF3593 domain-containing protein [Prochlorococcus]|uniref:DUF3593 domain-containing protein n=1 Tax=Prochlorococcus TaxID=1218 RepID=UPI0007B3EACB|nr:MULTISPECIES: DUF3593 domain-containing protein [Prochlorococcus]KZR60805.1 hypothetical protein PMIT1312_02473 [Prochlorococcus marinus str. MIT 1312]KZR79661.1 hypothetical protein PMIT1327_01720 [Prochlorococcus marinus str. MIT 1327]NMO84070.1 DUF3593 domain-containing protein [Prochlorococcus sp. P1344]NMP05042.1 DUF3593 domain-containing protein [Prochlorococcus sp. P1361]NMP13963.1 DUF3593 domain-containing protein [Prochlorococcus sp.P1363]
MIFATSTEILNSLIEMDPGPLYGLSLIPYLGFLRWAQQSKSLPRLSIWGFRLTLLFVFMTIIFSILADQIYGLELVEVDAFHGAAEAFLVLSDALVVLGFIRAGQQQVVKNS